MARALALIHMRCDIIKPNQAVSTGQVKTPLQRCCHALFCSAVKVYGLNPEGFFNGNYMNSQGFYVIPRRNMPLCGKRPGAASCERLGKQAHSGVLMALLSEEDAGIEAQVANLQATPVIKGRK